MHRWKLIAPLVVWLAIYLWPVPAGLNVNQWHYFAVFAAVITGLILESMPVGAVGLIGLTVAGVGGYIDPDPGKSLRWMLAGFAESTVWLIVGAFVFSIGYRKSQLGRRIALVLVRRLGTNTLGLGYAVAMSDFLLAPATPSNTARSGGIVYPIISNIPRIYGSEPGPTAGKIGTYVMWTAFAATAITQLAVLHRARAECGGARDRQEDGRRRCQLGPVVHRLRAARHSPDDPRAAAQLRDLPAGGEAQPGNLRLGREGARGDGPDVAQRVDHAGADHPRDVPVDRGLEPGHPRALARFELRQCHHRRLHRDLADAGHRRDRVCRHRQREERLGGVLLFHLAADAGLGPQRDRLHQMVCERIRKAARQGCRRRPR